MLLTFLQLDIERENSETGTIFANYHLENATGHILTYSLTMGASDSFAFQGPKQLTIRMLPYTRRSIEYVFLPLNRGLLAIPTLKVFDVNYKKTLVPLPATEELTIDKKYLWIHC